MRIENLEIGNLVTDGLGDYGRVAECVHGNVYYAYLAETDLDHYYLHADDAVTVSDYDDVCAECCA